MFCSFSVQLTLCEVFNGLDLMFFLLGCLIIHLASLHSGVLFQVLVFSSCIHKPQKVNFLFRSKEYLCKFTRLETGFK